MINIIINLLFGAMGIILIAMVVGFIYLTYDVLRTNELEYRSTILNKLTDLGIKRKFRENTIKDLEKLSEFMLVTGISTKVIYKILGWNYGDTIELKTNNHNFVAELVKGDKFTITFKIWNGFQSNMLKINKWLYENQKK